MPKPENILGQGFHTDPSRINKNGRPKGTRNRSTIARMILESKMSIDAVDADKREALEVLLKSFNIDPKTNQAEVLLTIAQVLNGLKGDARSYNAIMDSGYGKAIQQIEMIEPEQETHDLNRLTPDELTEYINLEKRIAELLSKCAIEIESSVKDSI